jgi:hypothetical protein
MTYKAYIVANKEQELDVLKKLEENGLVWIGGERPTEWVTSEEGLYSFPYMLTEREDGQISWSAMDQLENRIVVYDGRKEEKMYKVTQKFMNELIKWRDDMNLNAKDKDFNAFVNGNDIQNVPDVVYIWWRRVENSIERNNRLIAIIQWLNGEDMFEVEAPHKFVVRSEKSDNYGDYIYVQVKNGIAAINRYYVSGATKFDTREGALEWANSHQIVVEIDEDGNEVE